MSLLVIKARGVASNGLCTNRHPPTVGRGMLLLGRQAEAGYCIAAVAVQMINGRFASCGLLWLPRSLHAVESIHPRVLAPAIASQSGEVYALDLGGGGQFRSAVRHAGVLWCNRLSGASIQQATGFLLGPVALSGGRVAVAHGRLGSASMYSRVGVYGKVMYTRL